VLGGVTDGARLERMRRSQQHSGRKFTNLHKTGMMQADKLWSVMSAGWRSRKTQRPPAPLPMISDALERLRAPASASLRMTWLGHSTMLIELDGVRLVTDPVFGPRASPSGAFGPLRFHAPPIGIDDLPDVDAFLISHDHYDHLDLPTILAIVANPRFANARFITALGVGAHLEAWGVTPERIVELDWWEETRVGALTIHAAPSQHFSGRSVADRDHTLWLSFFVKGSASVYFSGDTGMSPHFGTIRERLGRPDVAMLEVGAFHPAWGDIHLGPDNARAAFAALGAEALVPVHWSTFALGAHPWDEPGEQLFVGAGKTGLPLLTPMLGEPFQPARSPITGPWWRDVPKRA
jgi:L-ascorbate metabolism protein UlaG (beta-lactamase superfamily)